MDKCKIMKLVPLEYKSNIVPENILIKDSSTKSENTSKIEEIESLKDNSQVNIENLEEKVLYAPRKKIEPNLKIVSKKKSQKRKTKWETISDSE